MVLICWLVGNEVALSMQQVVRGKWLEELLRLIKRSLIGTSTVAT